MPRSIKLLGGFERMKPDHHAEVLPGQAIRLFGFTSRAKRYDRLFEIGDQARYYQANASLFGPILGITKRVVIIENVHGHKVKLDFVEFDRLNHQFDIEKIEEVDKAFWKTLEEG